MDPRRQQRVAEAMREELSEIVAFELSDPRIGSSAVTEVHVSPDMRQARVMVSIPGDAEAVRQGLAALEGARHFMRRELASRLELFRVPELHFEASSEVDSSRLDRLLKRIRKGRPREAD